MFIFKKSSPSKFNEERHELSEYQINKLNGISKIALGTTHDVIAAIHINIMEKEFGKIEIKHWVK